jgi:hypothetical protein
MARSQEGKYTPTPGRPTCDTCDSRDRGGRRQNALAKFHSLLFFSHTGPPLKESHDIPDSTALRAQSSHSKIRSYRTGKWFYTIVSPRDPSCHRRNCATVVLPATVETDPVQVRTCNQIFEESAAPVVHCLTYTRKRS